jgi:hypothetical protein
MASDELSSMATPEFTMLIIEEHLRIARIHDGQAVGCEHQALKKAHEETAEFHRFLAHRFLVQEGLTAPHLG